MDTALCYLLRRERGVPSLKFLRDLGLCMGPAPADALPAKLFLPLLLSSSWGRAYLPGLAVHALGSHILRLVAESFVTSMADDAAPSFALLAGLD